MSEELLFWIATAPVGATSVLAEELAGFGAVEIRERSHDVKFQGSLEVGYRACLWSRSASRVFLSLGSIPADSTENLYQAVRRIDWREHIASGATLACSCTGANESIRHTLYGSQLLKDAVCDSLRAATGERPNISPQRPDVLVHLHIEKGTGVVAVDFSGESLHRRGYRTQAGRAPLKENVAGALLLRCGWPAIRARGGLFLDPMCGSGTLLIEAALIAADAAPALARSYFGFQGWRGHDAELWEQLRDEARARREARPPQRCILGSDERAEAVADSLANLAAAGVSDWVHVERRSVSGIARPKSDVGLLATNPPYGERMGDEGELRGLYTELGAVLRERFAGWEAAVLTGNNALGKLLGLHARRTHRFFNGAIECRLLRFDVGSASVQKPAEEIRANWSSRPGAQMFANRLAKNRERLGVWAAAQRIECYRVYDADMPEYAFAIDVYGAADAHIYVQEYAAPSTVAEEGARARRREVLAVLPQTLQVPLEHIHARLRKPQKGASQYEKRPHSAAERHEIHEGGLCFWVNFHSYLDTGLFLDHRLVRARLREWARGADFLNLFCYTGSATVYAAAGGARSTVSVDLSNTYLQWTRDNLRLNRFDDEPHQLVRADCLEWIATQEAHVRRFDLIFLDPPTFSNSKRMQGVLDVQRDHVGMIKRCMRLLRGDGRLVFSTNYRRFKLDTQSLTDFAIEDMSAATIPLDFKRNARIHRCYLIRHGNASASALLPPTS